MNRTYDDDLFKDSTMSFGDHLDELRSCLIKALLGLAVGICIGLYIGQDVVRLIEQPLQRALENYYLENSNAQIDQRYPGLSPELRSIVLRDHMVCEDVSIEPGLLFEDLKKSYPSQLGMLQLPEFIIQPIDLLHPLELCRSLKEAGSSEEMKLSGPRRVWSLLTAEEQKLVGQMIDRGTATSVQIEQMAAVLNRLLSLKDLYQKNEFTEIKLPEETVTGLEKLAASKDAKDVSRLNWTLLSTLWPKDLTPPHPFLTKLRLWRDVKDVQWVKPSSLTAPEAFMFYVKAAFISGLVISSPWVFYQLWSFVAAGLYPHEKKYVHLYLPVSIALFWFGAILTFLFVFDPVLDFLFDFNRTMGIEPSPRISDWMSFVLFMPIGFGISFQLPLLMLFLDRIGLVTSSYFLKHWKIAVIIISVFAAVATPSPDPYSMLLMAIPLVVLYFGGILLCRRGDRKPKSLQPH